MARVHGGGVYAYSLALELGSLALECGSIEVVLEILMLVFGLLVRRSIKTELRTPKLVFSSLAPNPRSNKVRGGSMESGLKTPMFVLESLMLKLGSIKAGPWTPEPEFGFLALEP